MMTSVPTLDVYYIKKNVIFRIFELKLITGIETIPLPPKMCGGDIRIGGLGPRGIITL